MRYLTVAEVLEINADSCQDVTGRTDDVRLKTCQICCSSNVKIPTLRNFSLDKPEHSCYTILRKYDSGLRPRPERRSLVTTRTDPQLPFPAHQVARLAGEQQVAHERSLVERSLDLPTGEQIARPILCTGPAAGEEGQVDERVITAA